MARPLTELIARRNHHWLDDHHDLIAEHLPTLALQTDDERAAAIAGRIQHIEQTSGASIDEILTDLAEQAGAIAPATTVLAELDRIAGDGRDFTHPDAPEWIVAPVSDADTIDTDLAAQIRQDYQAITDMHRNYRDQLTDDNAPNWAQSSLGPCPDDPEHAALWRATVADAAAYRSTHHITDNVTLAGSRPSERRAALDWAHIERHRAQLFEKKKCQQDSPGRASDHRPEIAPIEQRTRHI